MALDFLPSWTHGGSWLTEKWDATISLLEERGRSKKSSNKGEEEGCGVPKYVSSEQRSLGWSGSYSHGHWNEVMFTVQGKPLFWVYQGSRKMTKSTIQRQLISSANYYHLLDQALLITSHHWQFLIPPTSLSLSPVPTLYLTHVFFCWWWLGPFQNFVPSGNFLDTQREDMPLNFCCCVSVLSLLLLFVPISLWW